jgi:hypothetical protein
MIDEVAVAVNVDAAPVALDGDVVDEAVVVVVVSGHHHHGGGWRGVGRLIHLHVVAMVAFLVVRLMGVL